MLQSLEATIVARVTALFQARHGLTQRELAEALGVESSWVSHFLKGRRPANDVHLLAKMARYFGVTVGYLLNETDRGKDAGGMTLLAAWDRIKDQRDRQAVLHLALTLAPDTDDTHSAGSSESSALPPQAGRTTRGSKKRR